MGLIYLCLDLNEDRPIALKTFRLDYLPDRAAREAFLREGHHWVDLGIHPHIVRCYQVIRVGDGTEVYLALELIAKEQGRADASLRSWLLPGQPLPVETALSFTLQVVRGMAHAVERIPGFAHLDLKPENLLVGADRLQAAPMNRLRITDFGLARALENFSVVETEPGAANAAASHHTMRSEHFAGTPEYAAPEQFEGGAIDLRSDIYALGCILVEMLTGVAPVLATSRARRLQECAEQHCEGQVLIAAQGLPVALQPLLERCLAAEPGKRWGSWAEVEVALVAACSELGIVALAPEPEMALGRAERVAAGWSYSEMGVSYMDLGQATEAQGYFERARVTGAAEGERHLEAAGLMHLGLACFELDDVWHALRYHEQALAIWREIRERRGEGIALGSLGQVYTVLSDSRRAIGYYEQAITIMNEIGDRRGEGAALSSLGNLYRQLGDPHRSLSVYEQALVIDREIGDLRGQGIDMGNLGNAYSELGDLQCAIKHYKQALDIAYEIADLGTVSRTLGNLGLTYIRLGQTRQALECFEQRLKIAHEIDDIDGVATSSFNMALLYLQQGEANRALPLAHEAARIWKRTGHPENARRAQTLVQKIQVSGTPTSDGRGVKVVQQAFEVFLRADGPEAMRRSVEQFPFMVDPGFIWAVEQVIAEQALPEHLPTFEQHLMWLKQIARG